MLDVSRSGYYAWKKRSKQLKIDKLGIKVLEIFHKSRGIYGVKRIKAALALEGIKSSIPTIRKKFHKYGLAPRAAKKYKPSKSAVSKSYLAPNILNQNFHIAKPNRVWVSDFTYIKTKEGWKYLAVVIDLFSRKVVGWQLSNTMDSQMVLNAIDKAILDRKPAHNLVVHSDRGSQYCSHIYQEFLAKNKIRCSMSSHGNPYDNSCAESFFHSLKVEWLHNKTFCNITDLYSELLYYIEVFYNRQRLHSYLGYLSPDSFEQKSA